MIRRKQPQSLREQMVPRWQDLLVTLLILAAGTGIGNIFWQFAFTKANIISVYVLGTLLTSLFTKSYFCGVLSSVASVLLFNFFFTEPRLTLHAYEKGYPITIAIMLIVSIITVTLAIQNIRNIEEKERAALRAKNEQLRADLLRAISHDLRTPLTAISGNAGILMENASVLDAAKRRQLYTSIYDDSMWLANLVENLLSVSRIENGTIRLKMEPELLEEVFQEALTHLDRKAKEHTITVELPDDMLMAKMDARLIVQVVINIVNNAIKYTPPGSHVQVSARKRGESVEVRIADDGPGISDEAKAKLFDMFYTANNARGDGRRGLGLGLSLCRSIVQAHGGSITVEDNYPKGAIFSFTLPLAEVNTDEQTSNLDH